MQSVGKGRATLALGRQNGHDEVSIGRARRNTPSLLVGVLLVLGCGLGSVVLYVNAGNRVAVLAAAREVPAGAVLRNDDLTTVRISLGPGVAPVAAADRRKVVGRVARFGFARGTLLTPGALTTGSVIPTGQSVVAVAVPRGHAPPLLAGDRVWVVLLSTSAPGVISPQGSTSTKPAQILAEVFSVDQGEAGGDEQVSLLVATDNAATVAAAGSNRAVSLVLLSRR